MCWESNNSKYTYVIEQYIWNLILDSIFFEYLWEFPLIVNIMEFQSNENTLKNMLGFP